MATKIPRSTKCTLCDSEFSTKASCPLNPDIVDNPWKFGGVTGERGNPLKHPNAVDILRKEQEQTKKQVKENEEQSHTMVPTEQEVSKFVTDNVIFYRDYDVIKFGFFLGQETFPENKYAIMAHNDPLNMISDPGDIPFTLNKYNIKRVKAHTVEIPMPDNKQKAFAGHYNLNGDLVYITLATSKYMDNAYIGKYNDQLYVYYEYAWYPLNALETRYNYLMKSTICLHNDTNCGLEDYFIVHTAYASDPTLLPKHIDIKTMDTNTLEWTSRALVGPKTKDEILYLIKRKYVFPLKYAKNLPNKRKDRTILDMVRSFVDASRMPTNSIEFDLSPMNKSRDTARCIYICNQDDKKQGPLLKEIIKPGIYLTRSTVDLDFPRGFLSFMRLFTTTILLGRSHTIYDYVLFHLPQRDRLDVAIDYLKDLCLLIKDMLANESITIAQARIYQQEFQNLLKKYGLFSDEVHNQRNVIKRALYTDLMHIPPIIKQGTIIYPGGRKYYETMENFGKLNEEAWPEWCYTMLNEEYKDNLITYAKTLGMTFDKSTPKAVICLAILNSKEDT